ncbi:A/G-specific adenine glycosylase [Croceitalea sp. MTPC9]|uniref:A/G-specific adenine glycosylase n=1 Tax=unclassified Croceitalea TaxID=2632280 RepID=UPI002B3CEE1C|nr:A/G-specific adenine glycosylase [Croceitalea sp. MTPC6]GMN16877.1 A/G-specific adenine glycosylase [Croceitalea sp. MTPC9]
MVFSKKILTWYNENKRELPWRSTTDPYKIWLSEIMLQQTRVAQGLPYYNKFVDAFPTVYDLANADEEKVLKLWQGLGYYSRARNMHYTAKTIVNKFDGDFPNTYKELVKLKGVGDYTASAIASISFGEQEPVVDGNVYRVLARYFGIDIPINSSEGIKHFKSLAREIMDKDDVRDYNQGIMEFGAIQCAPKKPYCLHCPINDSCVALKENRVHELPVKLKKTKVKNKYFNYLVVFDNNNNVLFEQRTGKGIWQNLYQFPLLETTEEIELKRLKEEVLSLLNLKSVSDVYLYNDKPIVHKLSHQHLHTKFWILKIDKSLKDGLSWEKVTNYPVPVLIADFIKTFKI